MDGVQLARTVNFDPPMFVLDDCMTAPADRRFGFAFAAYGTMIVQAIGAAAPLLGMPIVPTDRTYALFTDRDTADPVTMFIADWRVTGNLRLRLTTVSDGTFDATWGIMPSNPREQTRGTVLLRAPGVTRRFVSVLELHRGTPIVRGLEIQDADTVRVIFFNESPRNYARRPQSVDA